MRWPPRSGRWMQTCGEKVAEAERLRATVEELRNATSHDVAASEAGILGLQVR